MHLLTTNDTRFTQLPGYSFQAHYCNVGPSKVKTDDNDLVNFDTINMHYIDYGKSDGPVILMLHGEPSWSYLYREMINIAAEAGYRVIAPDLIGFGKSDKFDQQSAYTYALHLQWLSTLVKSLDLKNIHLICQDWGGLLGLRLVAQTPDLFSSVVAANTMLPTGEHAPPKAFLDWQHYSQNTDNFDIGAIIQNATYKDLIQEVVDAYNAPFETEAMKAGARKFPMLVPISTNDPESQNNIKAWQTLSQFTKPFLTLFSDKDPVTKGGDQIFQKLVPGCAGQNHTILKNGGHFLQEDCAHELMRHALTFLAAQQKDKANG